MGDIERGYSDTGYIPEDGDNLGKIEQMAKNEAKEERMHRKMCEKYGIEMEEDVGGFLDRRNTMDRM